MRTDDVIHAARQALNKALSIRVDSRGSDWRDVQIMDEFFKDFRKSLAVLEEEDRAQEQENTDRWNYRRDGE